MTDDMSEAAVSSHRILQLATPQDGSAVSCEPVFEAHLSCSRICKCSDGVRRTAQSARVTPREADLRRRICRQLELRLTKLTLHSRNAMPTISARLGAEISLSRLEGSSPSPLRTCTLPTPPKASEDCNELGLRVQSDYLSIPVPSREAPADRALISAICGLLDSLHTSPGYCQL